VLYKFIITIIIIIFLLTEALMIHISSKSSAVAEMPCNHHTVDRGCLPSKLQWRCSKHN